MEKQILEKLEKIENKYNRLKTTYFISMIGFVVVIPLALAM
jgi:hypothetical protein